MEYHFPSYYKQFRCIGSDCHDNCCAVGWEIDIDDDTYEIYRKVGGEFGEKLKKYISTDNMPHFLFPNGRCPFLDKNNLCEIILTLGEDNLCDICTEHPRYYEWFDDITEVGVGLCCEAAGRLIFSCRSPFELETVGECEYTQDKITTFLFSARKKAFSIIFDKSVPFNERLIRLLDFSERVQICLDNENYEKINFTFLSPSPHKNDKKQTLEKVLSFYSTLDYIDDIYPALINDMRERLDELIINSAAFYDYYPCACEYEQLASYFIYRYFMKAAFDGDLISKIFLTVSSCIFIGLNDISVWLNKGNFTFDDRIEIAKNYSKEIEYSEENIDAFHEKGKTFSDILKEILA